MVSDNQRKEFLDHRNLLIDAERESIRSFDKSMITLSAGALGLSITFINKIAPDPNETWLLAFAWGFFIVSVLSTLISFLMSQKAIRNEIFNLDKSYDKDKDKDKDEDTKENIAGSWTTNLNWISISSFVVGVIFLASFAYVNLP